MERKVEKLVIIQGPTASGKSELALMLAEKVDGEIVNADSMQVYRGMDIGTAKPSREMRERVPHHLYDIVDPDVNFTAADFRREACRVIAEICGRGKRPILVGGTGLYIRVLTRGLVDSPGADESIRRRLEEEACRDGLETLHRRLEAFDPVTAARLHPNDGVRIIRAMEVFLLTGRSLSSFHEEHRFANECYECFRIGIHMDRELLYRRVEERVDRMIADGLVEEVRGLLAAGYSPMLKSMGSIGYREICAHLAGEYPLEEAIRLIKRNTRQYAKRQITWFRRDRENIRVDYPAKFDSIFDTVMRFYH